MSRAVFVDHAAAIPAEMAGHADAHLVPANVPGQPSITARGAGAAASRRFWLERIGAAGPARRADGSAREWRRDRPHERRCRRGQGGHGSMAVLVSLATSTMAKLVPGWRHQGIMNTDSPLPGYARRRAALRQLCRGPSGEHARRTESMTRSKRILALLRWGRKRNRQSTVRSIFWQHPPPMPPLREKHLPHEIAGVPGWASVIGAIVVDVAIRWWLPATQPRRT